MSNSTAQGMPKFEKLLQEARAKGEPVGSAHHEFNKQFKAWASQHQQKAENKAQLEKARDTKKAKGELRKATVAVNQALDKIKRVAIPKTEDQLRERKEQLERQKLADGYKSIMGDVSHVKSVGNGL